MISAVLGAGELELTGEERDRLFALSLGASARRAVRARIVLALAEPSAVPAGVAADLGVTVATVGKWRKRFEVSGVDGLIDAERPGRPKADLVLSAGEREQLTRWSRRGEGSAGGGGGAHGRRVGGPVYRQPVGRLGRRAAARTSAVDPAGQGRRGGGGHPGGDADQRHALVENLDGPACRPVALHGGADLEPL